MSPTSLRSGFPKLLTIRKYGDPVLRKKTKPVEKFDDDLRKLAEDMLHTMYTEPGVGLAASQVGVPLRMLVVDVSPGGHRQPLVLVNPKLVDAKGRVVSEEGCLSFPGISVRISRYQEVRVAALNEQGLPVEVSGDGLLARCLQHEMDHLDGKLMVDRVPWPERLKAFWQIRKRKKAGLW